MDTVKLRLPEAEHSALFGFFELETLYGASQDENEFNLIAKHPISSIIMNEIH